MNWNVFLIDLGSLEAGHTVCKPKQNAHRFWQVFHAVHHNVSLTDDFHWGWTDETNEEDPSVKVAESSSIIFIRVLRPRSWLLPLHNHRQLYAIYSGYRRVRCARMCKTDNECCYYKVFLILMFFTVCAPLNWLYHSGRQVKSWSTGNLTKTYRTEQNTHNVVLTIGTIFLFCLTILSGFVRQELSNTCEN